MVVCVFTGSLFRDPRKVLRDAPDMRVDGEFRSRKACEDKY